MSQTSNEIFSNFVDWIRPESDTRKTILIQAADIRSRIKGQAESDGLTVRSMPDSGSFAKKTGLRRHMRGGYNVEGQDVDLPFVIATRDDDGDEITELLNRFHRYAKASYPSTESTPTKSSIEMNFSGTGLKYDLVPMLAASKAGYQIIFKSDGTRRLTSVSKHTEFVEVRTTASEKLPGRVKFNECVRLMKWWRCIRLEEGGTIEKISTILIELMCAAAFDKKGVKETYTETLHSWFSWLAHVSANRIKIQFSDYQTIEAESGYDSNRFWEVLDPVNATNNVVPVGWGNIELSEFADWFAVARDDFSRILSLDAGEQAELKEVLKKQFGNAIITHGVN